MNPWLTRRVAVAFVLINALLSAYFLDTVHSANTTSRILPVLAVYEDGTYAIDKNSVKTIDKSLINGHYYSDKAPLSTWIALPFYGALVALHLTGSGDYHWLPVSIIGGTLCGSLPFVILLWLVFRRVAAADPDGYAVLLAMLPLYGSMVFAYTGVFMGHLLAGILLCGSYILLTRGTRPALCGLLLGLAVLAEYPTALAVPIWMVAMARTRPRDLRWFVLGGAPCALALIFYNRAITGSLTTLPYAYEAVSQFAEMRTGYGIRLPDVGVAWSLLFPPFRGLFFYAPALLAVTAAFVASRRSAAVRAMLSPLGLLAIGTLLLVSSYFVWWGGWSYGPRHLIPVSMLLFYEGIPLLAGRPLLRVLALQFSACGIVMAWLAKATVLFWMPEFYSSPVSDLALWSFRTGRFRPDAVPTLLFRVDPKVAAWIWLLLFVVGVTGLHALYRRTWRGGAVPITTPNPQ